MKTHESRLNWVFAHIGDVMEDQWGLHARVDEIKNLQEAVGVRGPTVTPARALIKSEPSSSDLGTRREVSPKLFVVTAPDTESLEYASERDDPIGYSTHLDEDWERHSLVEHPDGPVETPGEAWTQSRTI